MGTRKQTIPQKKPADTLVLIAVLLFLLFLLGFSLARAFPV